MSHDVIAYKTQNNQPDEENEIHSFDRTSGSEEIMELYRALDALDLCGSPPFSGIGGRMFTNDQLVLALERLEKSKIDVNREMEFIRACINTGATVYIEFC